MIGTVQKCSGGGRNHALLGGGVVEGARHNVDHSVGDAKRLVERLAVPDHLLEHLPRGVVVGGRDTELLDLLELMHAEDAEGVAAVAASLLAEAGGEARVAKGQGRGIDPHVEVVGSDGLLAGGNEVLLAAFAAHLVPAGVQAFRTQKR